MAELRNLEKFEENAIAMCKDQGQREKLTLKTRKRKSPLDVYDLKKLKEQFQQSSLLSLHPQEKGPSFFAPQ